MIFEPFGPSLSDATTADAGAKRPQPTLDLDFWRRMLATLEVRTDHWLKGFTLPKPQTIKKYERRFAEIRGGRTLEFYATSKGYYCEARASIVYCCSVRIQRIFAVMNSQLALGEIRHMPLLIEEIVPLVNMLKKTPPDREHKRCRDPKFARERPAVSTRKAKTGKSKRVGLKQLVGNWRDLMVRAAENNGTKYLLAIAVLSACGCRPSEVQKGVRVTLKTNGTMVFDVKGTKVRKGISGHDDRQIELYDSLGDDLRVLREAMGVTNPGVARVGDHHIVVAASAHGLWSPVSELAIKHQLNGKKHKIAPSSFRHQIASDLKRMGTAPEEISALLGHLATDTAKYYGLAKSGRSTRRYKATASNPIKVTHTDPRQIRAKQNSASTRLVPGKPRP